MKDILFRSGISILLLALMGFGCKKGEMPPLHAEGKIIEITGGCYGAMVLIEVSNPKNIGEAGIFNNINYTNTIGIPYFQKIGLPSELMKRGTWLYFEYREPTETEFKSNLFTDTSGSFICNMNIGPPLAKILIITKIIEYK